MHRIDKTLRPRNLTIHIPHFLFSQLSFCRSSDRYYDLKEKVAGGTRVLLLWTELLYLASSCKGLGFSPVKKLSLSNCTNFRGSFGPERLPHCSHTLQRCFGRNEEYIVRSEMENIEQINLLILLAKTVVVDWSE